ncbi:PREDICTED: LOW QUALITY PROTEIN: oleosin S1-2 [Tarenaya hassleriana]|uniref:LOW QUALITY PROTEIN: oleosin S1-2 n=1 Tax=Tarenaya hassleriana TaxID=28532 RepID=UPI00053C7CAD|nr:PREDICTED: LOW QUALITY PROTEIN: oleosin S1-2 [Tarenaya hassleriana]
MEDTQGREIAISGNGGHREITTATAVGATAAALAVGGPLLALMSLSFLATATLFLIAAPVLLIFSPVLLGARRAGFGAAGAMWVVGLGALVWVGRQVGVGGGVVERMVESAVGVRVKEMGNDPRGYLRYKSDVDNFSQADSS